MILWLFCMIIFHAFPGKIDTNPNGIYLGMVSPQWSCGMMFALGVNGIDSESHQGWCYGMEDGRPTLEHEWREQRCLWCLTFNDNVTSCLVRVTRYLGGNQEITGINQILVISPTQDQALQIH